MKKLLLCTFIIMVFMLSNAYADFTVFYDKDTDEVLFVAEKENKVRLSEEDSVKIKTKKVSGKISDYALTLAYTDYLWKSNGFEPNIEKINARIAAEAAEVARLEQILANQESAKDKLMSENPTSAQVLTDQAAAKVKLIELGLTEAEVDSLIVPYNGLGITEVEFNSLLE